MNVWEGGAVRGKEIQGRKLYIRRSLRRIEGGASSGGNEGRKTRGGGQLRDGEKVGNSKN